MEIINAVREGDHEAVRQWFQENPDAAANQLVSLGVSAAHWAASGADLQVCPGSISREYLILDKRASVIAASVGWRIAPAGRCLISPCEV
jgi:hypothetical protein